MVVQFTVIVPIVDISIYQREDGGGDKSIGSPMISRESGFKCLRKRRRREKRTLGLYLGFLSEGRDP